MVRLVRLITKYLREYIVYILGTVLLVVLQTFIQIILVLGEMKNILNQGVNASNMKVIYQSGLKMFLYSLILVLCTIGISFLTSRISGTLIERLRKECFLKVLSLSPEMFDRFGASSLLTRTVSDPKSIVSLVQFLVSRLIIFPVALACILIVTFLKSRSIFYILLSALFISILLLLVFKIYTERYYGELQKRIDHFNHVIAEKITGVRTIRAFGNEDYEEQTGKEDDQKIKQAAIRANRPLYLMNSITLLILNWTTVVIYLVASQEIKNGIISVSNLIYIFQYLSYCIMVLSLLPSLVNLLPQAIVASKRILELLDDDKQEEKERTEEEFIAKDGTVEFKDVSFRYLKGRNVLDKVSFTVRGGETLGIVGATGSGKTTILNLLMGLYKIVEGDILIDGVSIREIGRKTLLSQFSYSTQKNYILQDTIRSNIVLFREDVSEEKIMNACRLACFDEVIDGLPDGIDTLLSLNGTNLSGGQCKRLMLARALARESAIYLLDEPYASLDAITEQKVRQNIEGRAKKKTRIIVSSKINSILDADQILVLDCGKIVGFGTHDELLRGCGIYRELYDLQNSLETEE